MTVASDKLTARLVCPQTYSLVRPLTGRDENDPIAKKKEPGMDRFGESVALVPAILAQYGDVPLLGLASLQKQGEIAGFILIGATVVGVAVWGLSKLFKK